MRSLTASSDPRGSDRGSACLPGATFREIERKTVTLEQKERIVAMQYISRPQVPDDLIGALLFLSSDASAFMTGQSVTVAGAQRTLERRGPMGRPHRPAVRRWASRSSAASLSTSEISELGAVFMILIERRERDTAVQCDGRKIKSGVNVGAR
jgi:hypothetical protein